MRLHNRIKELIAVGASISANCQPCLQYHTSKAEKSGAAELTNKTSWKLLKWDRWCGGAQQVR